MKILIVITCVVLLSCCTSVLLVDGNEMQGKLSDRAENKVKDGKGMDSIVVRLQNYNFQQKLHRCCAAMWWYSSIGSACCAAMWCYTSTLAMPYGNNKKIELVPPLDIFQ